MSQRLERKVLSTMDKERVTHTLAQEEPQTSHVKEIGLPSFPQPNRPVLPSHLGRLRSGPALSGPRSS